MNIIELLQQIGPENIRFQTLAQSMTKANAKSKATEVSFMTSMITPRDLLVPDEAKYVGWIIWMPKDKMPKKL